MRSSSRWSLHSKKPLTFDFEWILIFLLRSHKDNNVFIYLNYIFYIYTNQWDVIILTDFSYHHAMYCFRKYTGCTTEIYLFIHNFNVLENFLILF
jgi:hypothetical protein